MAAFLLREELIARKSEYLQSFSMISLIKIDQLLIVFTCQSSLTGDIYYNNAFGFVTITPQIDFIAINVCHNMIKESLLLWGRCQLFRSAFKDDLLD